MITLLLKLYYLITGRRQGPQTSPPRSTLETTYNTVVLFGDRVSYYRTFVLDDESVELQSADRAMLIRLYRGGLRLEDKVSGTPQRRLVRVVIDNKYFEYPVEVLYSKYDSREGFMGYLTELVLAHVSLMHPEEGKLLSQENLNPRRWRIEHVDPS